MKPRIHIQREIHLLRIELQKAYDAKFANENDRELLSTDEINRKLKRIETLEAELDEMEKTYVC